MSIMLPFKENVLLKNYCTYGIGGPARFFLEIRTTAEMQQAITHCHQNNIQFIVIGKGSNCLFDDKGFNGAVLLNKIDFLDEITPGKFHVGAGYNFSLLGVQTAKQGWGGLEFASGIPATVGGAVYMNAGANGAETCETLVTVDFVAEDGGLHHYQRADLAYSYRHSPFQDIKGAIVGATFQLHKSPESRQKQIEIVNYRIKTQPYSEKSAGCVFMNPTGNHAGALIDQCLLKGFAVGGAAVSQVHANFLINKEGATCNDMLHLIDEVRKKVHEKTGLTLQSEVRYIPYDALVGQR